MARSAWTSFLYFLAACGMLFGDDAKVHLSAYYYPWYDSNGRHWKEGYYGDGPALGKYSSRDPDVIVRHVDWSRQMGIKNWVCAWWGKDSWEDVTIRYRIAPILDQLVDSENTFCLFYESEGLLGLDPGRGIEFDAVAIRKFTSDFAYFAEVYFSHPSYFRIRGCPVVYLYLSRTFSGDYAKAISQAREAAKAKGVDLYLVGDEVYWGGPDRDRIRHFDAITAYNMHGPAPQFDSPGDWSRFIEDCGGVYQHYRDVARELGVSFIPGILPGFDSRGAGGDHYIIPREFRTREGLQSTTLKGFVKLAKETLDPELRSATITSFNEWHEGTQLEPSRNGNIEDSTLTDFSNGK